jgi:hypothetical protein
MSFFPRAARVFVVLALTGAASALPTSAVAAQDSSPAPRPQPHHAASTAKQLHAEGVATRVLRLRKNKRLPKRASIVFDKSWKDPFSSLITFRAWARTGPKGHRKWVLVEHASWRAGGGLGGRAGKDECHRGVGWLPDGTYSFVQHNRRKAPLVNGRVFELQPKACRNGTVRQLLFIHSEQTTSNTQCKNRRGDDLCRWEVPVYNDYRSNGCIKMSPTDLRDLTRRFHHYFRAEVRYSTRTVRVRVTR